MAQLVEGIIDPNSQDFTIVSFTLLDSDYHLQA